MVIFLENLWCIYYYHEVPDEEKKRIVIELNFTTIYYITELAACYFGRIEKNRQFWTKIEMIFLLLQRALISYFSFSSSILSYFLANVINIRSNNKFLPLQFKQKFLFEKKVRNENNDWWKRKQTVPRVVNNTMMMKKQLKKSRATTGQFTIYFVPFYFFTGGWQNFYFWK